MKEVSILSSLILYIKDALQVKKSSLDFSIGKNNNQLQNYPPTTRKEKNLYYKYTLTNVLWIGMV